jgi:hypothetical protein
MGNTPPLITADSSLISSVNRGSLLLMLIFYLQIVSNTETLANVPVFGVIIHTHLELSHD